MYENKLSEELRAKISKEVKRYIRVHTIAHRFRVSKVRNKIFISHCPSLNIS